MYEFWVSTSTPGMMTEIDAMNFFNEVSKELPDYDFVAIDPQGRAIYRTPKKG